MGRANLPPSPLGPLRNSGRIRVNNVLTSWDLLGVRSKLSVVLTISCINPDLKKIYNLNDMFGFATMSHGCNAYVGNSLFWRGEAIIEGLS